ncbi:MAG: hypothetical protein AAGD86_01230, partial [Pseudomonadota bacterium]
HRQRRDARGSRRSGSARCPVLRRWTLIARDGHGPRIPAMPALVLARGMIDGRFLRTGAQPCVAAFTLAQFTEAVAQLSIEQQIETDRSAPGRPPITKPALPRSR